MPGQKILIVEDECIIARDLQNILNDLGFSQTSVAASGAESLKIACSLRPDLVFMDIKLKGNVDGIHAARKILNRFPTSIIYLTAYTDELTWKRASRVKSKEFIHKPFDEKELKQAVERILKKE